MRMRPLRLAAGICALGCAWLLLQLLAFDPAATREAPVWTPYVWVAALLASLMAGPVLIANGLGLFTSEILQSAGSGRAPSARQFLAVYFGLLGSIGVASLLHKAMAGVEPLQTALVLGGAAFLLATTGQPWWLFATIRRTGWFALIGDDRAMRLILGVLGAVLSAFGWLAPPPR